MIFPAALTGFALCVVAVAWSLASLIEGADWHGAAKGLGELSRSFDEGRKQ
jgi:hypothetical protein